MAQVPLLRAAVDRAAAGSDAWCAVHTWLGQASLDSADPAGALRALALAVLSLVACVGGDRVGAVQLATQAERIAAGQRLESLREARQALRPAET